MESNRIHTLVERRGQATSSASPYLLPTDMSFPSHHRATSSRRRVTFTTQASYIRDTVTLRLSKGWTPSGHLDPCARNTPKHHVDTFNLKR